ncbi:MAG: hypothetical protein E7202_03645 [Selenomonas ruminantium]|jgi:hypothetical protein|nr:hypothetical protein [Selenomonas ruminantium]
MKIKRNALVIAFLCISVIISGCSYTSGNVDSVERSRGLDFSNEKKQNDNSIQKRELKWQLVTVSKQSNKKLNIELPFEFYDCRKSDDLPEIKNMEAYIHKEDRSMIAIDYGVIVDPNKQMRFNVDTFSNLVDGAKELEVVKNEKRNLNGREITYIACKGKTEKDNSFCMLEFVGVQVDNEYWMVSYAYYEDDVVMAEIAKRSIESMRIE